MFLVLADVSGPIMKTSHDLKTQKVAEVSGNPRLFQGNLGDGEIWSFDPTFRFFDPHPGTFKSYRSCNKLSLLTDVAVSNFKNVTNNSHSWTK